MIRTVATLPSRDLTVLLEDCPDPLVPMFERDLAPLLPHVPVWCARLRITFTPDSDDRSLAHAEADVEYRQARIVIRPLYLTGEEDERRATMAHEVAHLILWPLSQFADLLARESTEAESSGRRMVEEQLRIATETVTEDVARAIARGIGE